MLRGITDGLDLGDAYGATLDRIKAQGGHKSRLGMTTLMWLCYSERPLRAVELCHALAVEIGSTDYNADDVPLIQTVLSCCQGFVVVDEGRSTARLIHRTLREYLVNHRSLFQSPHSTIAETCLVYLNSQQVMALKDSGLQSIQHLPFLGYSAIYWGAHIKNQLTDVGKALALKLFSHYECHISIRPLLGYTLIRYHPLPVVGFRKFTGLHFASIFGLIEIAKAFAIMDGVDINGEDETGATPLLWAAMKGHETVVKLLLGWKEVNPDRPDDDGRTPLSWAAGNGHGEVVKLLLGRKDVDPNRADFDHRTPISWASENGHEPVVKLLLGREDIDLDRPDSCDRAPISWAAENGHVAVVKLLLGRKCVNPDRPDDDRRAPISWAAGKGHRVVVKLLLGRKDVDPNREDYGDQTQISWACENGHETVVKLLLGREDIVPDGPDFSGRAPISWAAENGHEAVVKLLLGWKGVNPDRPHWWGRTPISLAALGGHGAVVKLLLAREDVNPDCVGNHAARHTLRILPLSLDSFRGRALPSGIRRLRTRA